MAQYHFESKLSPEQIQARISVFAKPADSFGWRMGESALYYKFYKRTSFFLIKTKSGKSGGAAINQPVFLGKLTEKGAGTDIDGKFFWERKKAIVILILFFVLFLAVRPGALMLIMAGTFLLLGFFLLLALASSLYAEEEQAVLTFIEKHLLS